MSRTIVAAAMIASLTTITACCCGGDSGYWDKASRQVAGDNFKNMDYLLENVEDSPERQAVQELIDAGYLAGHAGELDVFDTSLFEAEVATVTADGKITEVEVEVLQRKYEEMISP